MMPTTQPAHPPRTTTEAPAAPPLALDPARDPRDVFLSAADVHDYLGLGRTQGYAVTGTAAFQAVAALPGKWRLADVRAYFDARFAQTIAVLVAPDAVPAAGPDTDEPPARALAAVGRPARARRSPTSTADANAFLDRRRRSAAPGATRTGGTR